MKIKVFCFFSLILFSSCAKRNLAYFSDLQDQAVREETIGVTSISRIQPDDLLSITVVSLNPEANALFNRGVMPSNGAIADHTTGLRTQNTPHIEGYLVDQNGYIDFPVLGKIKVGGMTKDELKNCLMNDLQEYLKDPVVNIRYLNYRITVIGEVNQPSTFTIPSEKIHILAALGLAGDMTAFGKRENVLLIREENGKRIIARLNLNSSELFNSPYFYLQQNDVVYVEPVKARAEQASLTRNNITTVASVVTALSLLIMRLGF